MCCGVVAVLPLHMLLACIASRGHSQQFLPKCLARRPLNVDDHLTSSLLVQRTPAAAVALPRWPEAVSNQRAE